MKKQHYTTATSDYLDFKPYIYVKTEIDGKTSLKYIDLEKDKTLEYISAIIREHFYINLGRCIFCGNITGYIYHESIEKICEFDVCGNLIEEKTVANSGTRNVTSFGGLFALLV